MILPLWEGFYFCIDSEQAGIRIHLGSTFRKEVFPMNSALLLLALSNMLFFALHIGTIGSFPKPLSKEEELDCLLRLKQGDHTARDKLIEHNLRLVAHIIKEAYSRKRIFPDR